MGGGEKWRPTLDRLLGLDPRRRYLRSDGEVQSPRVRPEGDERWVEVDWVPEVDLMVGVSNHGGVARCLHSPGLVV